jgi:hypothetical protein
MDSTIQKLRRAAHTPATPPSCAGASVGIILGADADGQPLVDFPGNPYGPVAARVAVTGEIDVAAWVAACAQVVLVFERAEASLPIIVGVIAGTAPVPPVDKSGPRTISAEKELVLRCGKGSLTIRDDGNILIKGTNVTSRATDVHKIKGGAVRIN